MIFLFAMYAPAHASEITGSAAPPGGPSVTIDSQAAETDDDSDRVPKWVWATLVMTGFVALSVLTMVLARDPVRHAPPPVEPAEPSGEHAQAGDREGG